MLHRYPHIGKIVSVVENDVPTGISTLTPTETEVKGRFEPAGQNKNIDHAAKWYCQKTDNEPFKADGAKFVYEGKLFKIVQLFNYQTHCEIWLE